MNKKISILITVMIVFLGALFYLFQYTDVLNFVKSYVTPNAEIVSVPVALPSTLTIPKLGVDRPIEHVGLTDEGDMATPENVDDVAWYKFGTVPGEKGQAVIAGHLDNYKGEPLVFARLSELAMGDDVYVTTADNERLHFRVVDIKMYPYDETNTEPVFGPSDKVRLNLITCEGEWLNDKVSYDERLVVFTELISRN